MLERARQLAELCRRREVLFIVNDRPDIALLSDADGVHLGQTDLSVAEARRIIGPQRLIGRSTHTPEQFHSAVDEQPDYIAVGPMFASTTKPQEHIPGPGLLKLALEQTTIPIVPIGGISTDNAGILKEAGAKCLCACSAVIEQNDVCAAARLLSGA